jgi:hypothetical protein
VEAEGDNNSVRIKGQLLDTHIAEASVVNIFEVPISSPIMGLMNDPFIIEAVADLATGGARPLFNWLSMIR